MERTLNWVNVRAGEFGDCYRVEPGVIITGYLCSGDLEPSFVERHAMPGPWSSLGQLKAAHAAAGKYYFSAGTVSFFGARFNEVIGGRLLIDSVQPPYGGRQYRVSVWGDGAITSSRIGEFESLVAARRFAREIIKAVL
jgi:hypothetical protein